MVFWVSGIVKWQKIEWTIMIYDELLKFIRWATIFFKAVLIWMERWSTVISQIDKWFRRSRWILLKPVK